MQAMSSTKNSTLFTMDAFMLAKDSSVGTTTLTAPAMSPASHPSLG